MKKLLIYMGADKTSYNISKNCFDFILSKNAKYKDSFQIVVTDDDKTIIDYLKSKNIEFISKNESKNFSDLVSPKQYDWLLNLWGHNIFPDKFLNKFENNLNLHPSYLPYGRGKDSVVWTIFYNYIAGATIHKMTKLLDSGPIYYQEDINYSFPTTGKELYDKCCELCLILFKKSWFKIREGKLKPIDQKSGDFKTYYRKELFENNLIDLDKNTSIRDFVFKSISQDFSPGFNYKIKYNGKLYSYRSIIDPIKEGG